MITRRRAVAAVVAVLAVGVSAFAGCSDRQAADVSPDSSSPDPVVSPEGGAEDAAPDPGADAAPNDAAPDAPEATYTDLADASAWSTFDITPINANATGYYGATSDGRYLYFSPMRTPAAIYHGLVTRYDTTAPYTQASSWTTFDIASLDDAARGFPGSVFDGRYVYFMPRTNNTVVHGRATRYDTTAPFGAASSWTIYNIEALHPSARGFGGGVFDGRYVYYVPFLNPVVGPSGLVARYDSTAPFTTPSSWKFFDVTTVNGGAKGFHGGIFDGRYVYLVPNYDGTNSSGLVPRYDTQAPFTAATSWTSFDMTAVDPKATGYNHAGFDGRNLYFSPIYDGTNYSGLVVRYDTHNAFGSVTSWSKYDLAPKNADAVGFAGTAFDGKYVYLIPCLGHTVARFAAKDPPGPNGVPSVFY
jgi:hypothetical protein